MNPLFLASLTVLAVNTPLYLVWLVGLILAIVNWKKMPRASLLIVIALAILFIASIAFTIFSTVFPLTASRNGIPITRIGVISGIVGILNVLLVTSCWGLLLGAIFSRREKAA